jgi:hypothetical protein
MNSTDLDAIDARAGAATPGPWKSLRGYEQDDPGAFVCRAGDQPHYVVATGSDPLAPADADFIAAARTDVPALVAQLRAARAANANLTGFMLTKIEAAVLAEREACAKTCDDLYNEVERKGHEIDNLPGVLDGCHWSANAIRARK